MGLERSTYNEGKAVVIHPRTHIFPMQRPPSTAETRAHTPAYT